MSERSERIQAQALPIRSTERPTAASVADHRPNVVREGGL